MSLDAAIIEKLAKVGLTVMRPDVHAPAASMPLFISRIAAGAPQPADEDVGKALDLNEYCMLLSEGVRPLDDGRRNS